MSDNTWVPVLVRLEDFEEITRLVHARESNRETGTDLPAVSLHADQVDTDHDGTAPGNTKPTAARRTHADTGLTDRPLWRSEDLARLAEGDTITTQRWTQALDVCTQNLGIWLTTSEIADRTGMSINEWRDAARKITRHLKRHYPNVPARPDGDPVWPLRTGGNADVGGEVWWTISPEMADLWTEVRGQ